HPTRSRPPSTDADPRRWHSRLSAILPSLATGCHPVRPRRQIRAATPTRPRSSSRASADLRGRRPSLAMINFVLLISRQGKVRLTKWYSPYTQKERTKRSSVSLVGSFLLEGQNSATLSSGEVTRLCTEGMPASISACVLMLMTMSLKSLKLSIILLRYSTAISAVYASWI
uniref:AP complex mu/sigma subunit domain-containing protein n=1 Tax=Aegilops tauschii subsp. strangulata TaxID=200361 RepID=A0A453LZL8_AEGTS